MERRDRLASGLRRPLGCVWPEPVTEAHAGRLVLWVGDRDMNATKPPAWPLADAAAAPTCSQPVPFGHDQRGRLVALVLMFANVLIGAMPRQGKTFALRVLLTAAALDPFAQLRIFELKGTGDLGAVRAGRAPLRQRRRRRRDRRAAWRRCGSCTGELDTRARTIRGLPRHLVPESKVTPELSRRKSLGLHTDRVRRRRVPGAVHPRRVRARKPTSCAPRSSSAARRWASSSSSPPSGRTRSRCPPGISANVGIRFCLRVMDQPANDMVLGTSAYKAGIRATTFGPRDRGIGYLVGASDDPQIVRSAYLDGPATERIMVRARAARLAAGTLSGHALGEVQPTAGEAASILDHILTVVPAGEGKVWSETRDRPAGRGAPGPLRRLGTRPARRRAQAARHRHGPDQPPARRRPAGQPPRHRPRPTSPPLSRSVTGGGPPADRAVGATGSTADRYR